MYKVYLVEDSTRPSGMSFGRRSSVIRLNRDAVIHNDLNALVQSINPDVYHRKYVFETAWEVVNKGRHAHLQCHFLYAVSSW